MHPRLDALPPPQRRLWPELRATPRRFVLYGGTVIALRLAHRESEDFDFFSFEPLVGDHLLAGIPYLSEAMVVHRARDTLTCMVDRGGPVRVSFFGGLTLKALTYFDDGDLAELPAEVRKRLSQAAAGVDPTSSVPRYESRPGLGASGPRKGPSVP